MDPRRNRLILASASASRAQLLAAAGVAATVEASGIDESPIKPRVRARGGSAIDGAQALAEAKAQAVAVRHPGAVVIGADQILVFGNEWFDKPADLAAARDQLRALRGQTHMLATAVCAVRDGICLWRAASTPRLTMRRFGDGFLDSYLAREGDAVLGSVGAYQLEGSGVQLFARIDGDYFAILGLPLLELLGFLRECGAREG